MILFLFLVLDDLVIIIVIPVMIKRGGRREKGVDEFCDEDENSEHCFGNDVVAWSPLTQRLTEKSVN